MVTDKVVFGAIFRNLCSIQLFQKQDKYRRKVELLRDTCPATFAPRDKVANEITRKLMGESYLSMYLTMYVSIYQPINLTIYLSIYHCRQYFFGLLGFISRVLMKGWR